MIRPHLGKMRKLHLKTHKNWDYVGKGGLSIPYYGHDYHLNSGLMFENVAGVYQGIEHRGVARKSTRNFYVLETYWLHGEWHTVLFGALLPKAKTKRELDPITITDLSSKQMQRKFGTKYKDWTPQHLATQMLEQR